MNSGSFFGRHGNVFLYIPNIIGTVTAFRLMFVILTPFDIQILLMSMIYRRIGRRILPRGLRTGSIFSSQP